MNLSIKYAPSQPSKPPDSLPIPVIVQSVTRESFPLLLGGCSRAGITGTIEPRCGCEGFDVPSRVRAVTHHQTRVILPGAITATAADDLEVR
jgi:hypothetical protein